MTTSTTVLDSNEAVLAALTPLRRRILAKLSEPGSASSLARELGLPRQKVNYHLRQLESHGLVRLIEEKQRRGLTERIYEASAERMFIDPVLLTPGDLGAADSFAAEQLAATAARAVHDIGTLLRAAAGTGQRLATFTLDGEMTFATPQDLRSFVAELGELMARYDRPAATGGRRHRFIAMSHPSTTREGNE